MRQITTDNAQQEVSDRRLKPKPAKLTFFDSAQEFDDSYPSFPADALTNRGALLIVEYL